MAMQLGVWRGAVLMNQHLFCFFIVSLLDLCGSTSGRGLVSQWLMLIILVKISCSLLAIQVTLRHEDPSSSLFDYFVFGSFGMNGITDYLGTSKPPLINF